MNPVHKRFLVLASFAAAVFFGVFAAFGWDLGGLSYADELAAAVTSLGAGLFIGAY